jgi:hypothetical protein
MGRLESAPIRRHFSGKAQESSDAEDFGTEDVGTDNGQRRFVVLNGDSHGPTELTVSKSGALDPEPFKPSSLESSALEPTLLEGGSSQSNRFRAHAVH